MRIKLGSKIVIKNEKDVDFQGSDFNYRIQKGMLKYGDIYTVVRKYRSPSGGSKGCLFYWLHIENSSGRIWAVPMRWFITLNRYKKIREKKIDSIIESGN